MKPRDYAPGEPPQRREVLCGVDEHSRLEKENAKLVKENAELKAVLRDVLEGKGLALTTDELENLRNIQKLIKSDGCWDCVYGVDGQHSHHPVDRAASYRALFTSTVITSRGYEGSSPGALLLRILDVITKAGA